MLNQELSILISKKKKKNSACLFMLLLPQGQLNICVVYVQM